MVAATASAATPIDRPPQRLRVRELRSRTGVRPERCSARPRKHSPRAQQSTPLAQDDPATLAIPRRVPHHACAMTQTPAPQSTPEQTPKLRADAPRHIPVMLAEVLAALAPADGDLHIDGTFGAGGYSSAILDAAACRVIAFDRDITAVRAAADVYARYPDRLNVIHARFGDMEALARLEATPDNTQALIGPFADGVVLDIGVSSMQLDEAARGFSFLHDGPLDMRMSAAIDPLTGETSNAGPSAADFLNSANEETIANVLYDLGEEKKSRLIARAIVHDRVSTPFTTTRQLAGLVFRLLGGRNADGKHPATRTFQALRIHVNDELAELEAGLRAAEHILKPGGRLVVVTFHSLEDRIVKRFLKDRTGTQAQGSRHLPPSQMSAAEKNSGPSFRFVNSKPLSPGEAELELNPRSRSAHLRAAIRTEAPPRNALPRDP